MKREAAGNVVAQVMRKSKKVSSKKAAIRVFENISAALTEHWGEKPVWASEYAATEILIYGVQQHLMSWTRLKVLARRQHDYGKDYEFFGSELATHVADFNYEYTTRQDYFLFCCQYGRAEDYLAYIDALVNSWDEKLAEYSMKPKDSLHGKSAQFWQNYTVLAGGQVPSTARVARAYELDLLKNEEFTTELRKLARQVNEAQWYYSLDQNWLGGLSEAPSDGGAKWFALQERFRKFCLKWCIELISKNFTVGKLDLIDFRAMRVTVKPDDNNTGLRIFIPRYYRFSQLENYQDEDFTFLKRGMNEIFDSYKMPAKRKDSLVEMKAQVKRVRREELAKGRSPHDAWEVARKSVGWSVERMTRFMGKQPKVGATSRMPHK